MLTTAFCRCCSEFHGPTRNLLTSQFLTPAELRQILKHCNGRGDRQGLMLAAMLALGGVQRLQVSSAPSTPQLMMQHSPL